MNTVSTHSLIRSCQHLNHYVPRDALDFSDVRLDPIWETIPETLLHMEILPRLTTFSDYLEYKEFSAALDQTSMDIQASRLLSVGGNFWGFCCHVVDRTSWDSRHITLDRQSMIRYVQSVKLDYYSVLLYTPRSVVFNMSNPSAWMSLNLPPVLSPTVNGYWEWIGAPVGRKFDNLSGPFNPVPPIYDAFDEWMTFLPRLRMELDKQEPVVTAYDMSEISYVLCPMLQILFCRSECLSPADVAYRQLIVLRALEVMRSYPPWSATVGTVVQWVINFLDPRKCPWFPEGWDLIRAAAAGDFKHEIFARLPGRCIKGGLIGGNVEMTYHFLRIISTGKLNPPSYYRSSVGDMLMDMYTVPAFPERAFLTTFMLDTFSLRAPYAVSSGSWPHFCDAELDDSICEFIETSDDMDDLYYRTKWYSHVRCVDCSEDLVPLSHLCTVVQMATRGVQLLKHVNHILSLGRTLRTVTNDSLSARSLLECVLWLMAAQPYSDREIAVSSIVPRLGVYPLQLMSTSSVAPVSGAGPEYSWLRI